MTSDRDMENWDAAYLLGALTAEEAADYERYLSEAPERTAALNDSEELLAVLDVLSPEEALALLGEQPEPNQDQVPVRVQPTPLTAAAQRRRQRSGGTRWASFLAAAAALLLLGGIVGYTAIPRPSPPGVSFQAMAAGERPGVTAALAVTEEPWGTRLDWHCEYTKDWAKTVSGYDLVVTTDDGQTTVATWSPVGEDASNLAAATMIPTADIRSVIIRETGTATPLAVSQLT